MAQEKNEENLIALLAVMMVEGIGPRLIRRFIETNGNWDHLLHLSSFKKLPIIGEKIENHKNKFSQYLKEAEKEISYAQQFNIHIIPYWSPLYPKRLWKLEDAPPILFVKGNVKALSKPTVSIVGTRKPTPYGLTQTQLFAQALVKKGIHILSGLAYGIDQMAHSSALNAEGITSAVLGHGFAYLYPYAHKSLAVRICSNGGCLITEYRHSVQPEAHNFPVRNRIIAGLSHAIFIPESYQKGGALITARYAYKLNRPIFALPGPITSSASEGVHFLIKNQMAQICVSPEDILEALKLPAQSASLPLRDPLTSLEEKLISLLETHGTLTLDEMVSLTTESVSTILANLMTLECKGYITSLPGQRYQLSVLV